MNAIIGEIFTPKPQIQIVTPAAATLAAQAPIAPIKDREHAGNERRQSGKNERDLDFRAVLSSTTFTNLADATSVPQEKTFTAPQPRRQSRVPDFIPEVISGTEAAQLYNAARATNINTAASAQFRAATSSYAKSFFSVEGTYARPGEALELSI